MAGNHSVQTAYIVTGTTRGIGKALADAIVERGRLLFSISRAPERHDPGRHNFHCDLRDSDQVASVIQRLVPAIPLSAVQQLILINNAGRLTPIGSLETIVARQINDLMQINVVAPACLMGAFMRLTAAFEGQRRIINISSGAAHHPYAGWSLYCASKAALEMLSACAAAEQGYRTQPVGICSVAPGVVDTDMQADIRRAGEADFPARSKFVNMSEQGRLFSPRQVAQMLLDLDDRGQFEPGRCYDLRDAVWEQGHPRIQARSD